MPYLIYNKDTTIMVIHPKTRKSLYETKGAVRAAMTRFIKNDTIKNEADYAYAEAGFFARNIEKSFPVKNLLSGKTVMEKANTPACCSVGSESYFSM